MMEYAGEGEVYRHLAKSGRFSEKRGSRVSPTKHSLRPSSCLLILVSISGKWLLG